MGSGGSDTQNLFRVTGGEGGIVEGVEGGLRSRMTASQAAGKDNVTRTSRT